MSTPPHGRLADRPRQQLAGVRRPAERVCEEEEWLAQQQANDQHRHEEHEQPAHIRVPLQTVEPADAGPQRVHGVRGRQVILPTDTDALKIHRSRDMISLFTCTPYGINTHRLVVNAYRTKWPLSGRVPSVWPPGWLYVLLIILLILLVLAVILSRIYYSRRQRVAALHAVGWQKHGWFHVKRKQLEHQQSSPYTNTPHNTPTREIKVKEGLENRI